MSRVARLVGEAISHTATAGKGKLPPRLADEAAAPTDDVEAVDQLLTGSWLNARAQPIAASHL